MQSLDMSFERDGRPLVAWLGKLVADDAATRLAAGEALRAMQLGIPSVHTNLCDIDWKSSPDIEGQGQRFDEAVRAAVSGRRFPTHDFVRRLIARRIALSDDWMARVEQDRVQPESPVARRLGQRLAAASEGDERTEAFHRLMRWMRASIGRRLKRSNAIYAGAEAMSSAGLMALGVFNALDSVLLTDRDGLWRMLDHKYLYSDAARALARIGPAAAEFAGFFVEELDSEKPGFPYHGAPALGSIGRDDPGVIDKLLLRVRTGSAAVRLGAILALGHAGPPLAGRLDPALDILVGATYQPILACAAIGALASVGRGREPALRRVLEMASPRPSGQLPGKPHADGCSEDDMSMAERGSAISALRHFPRFGAEVVPVLVDALDSFEEYDPDSDDFGDHARVCDALGAFGAEAVAAVPRLTRYLDELSSRPDAYHRAPNAVCRLLASLGGAAAESLPALERLRTAQTRADEAASDSLDSDEPLDRAILAIRGQL
jgi:hypothetical protein